MEQGGCISAERKHVEEHLEHWDAFLAKLNVEDFSNNQWRLMFYANWVNDDACFTPRQAKVAMMQGLAIEKSEDLRNAARNATAILAVAETQRPRKLYEWTWKAPPPKMELKSFDVKYDPRALKAEVLLAEPATQPRAYQAPSPQVELVGQIGTLLIGMLPDEL